MGSPVQPRRPSILPGVALVLTRVGVTLAFTLVSATLAGAAAPTPAAARHGALPQEVAPPSEAPDSWVLAFVDVETTGLIPGHHEMIDVGIIVTDLEGVELDRHFERIMPRHPERLSPQAAAINGFSVERWERLGAVAVADAVTGVSSFLERAAAGRYVLMVAYNASFDAAFLDHLYRAAGHSWGERVDFVLHYFLDLPSMAWSLGYRQVLHGVLPEALGVEPETRDPLQHTGISGAEYNVRVYRALLGRGGPAALLQDARALAPRRAPEDG